MAVTELPGATAPSTKSPVTKQIQSKDAADKPKTDVSKEHKRLLSLRKASNKFKSISSVVVVLMFIAAAVLVIMDYSDNMENPVYSSFIRKQKTILIPSVDVCLPSTSYIGNIIEEAGVPVASMECSFYKDFVAINCTENLEVAVERSADDGNFFCVYYTNSYANRCVVVHVQ